MSGARNSGGFRVSGRMKAAGIGLVIVLVVALAVWQGWSRFHRERPRAAAPKTQTFSMGKPMTATPVAATADLGPKPAPKAEPQTAELKPAAQPPLAPPRVLPMGSWQDSDTSSRAPAKPPATPVQAPQDPDVVTPGGPQSEYAARMQTTKIGNLAPTPLRLHNEYTIKKGWKIPCTPDVPLSSELPGPISCTTDAEVRSLDNTTTLLPKGTTINGQIERGLANGDHRLFLVWTDALTPAPDLLPIDLGGMPAADQAGQIGVPGDLNPHTWEKLKGLAFVTLIQTGSNVAVAAAQSGSRNNYFGPFAQMGNSAALDAFAADRNIPTTLYRGAGQPLVVYVSKYVDLYKYYKNVPASSLRVNPARAGF